MPLRPDRSRELAVLTRSERDPSRRRATRQVVPVLWRLFTATGPAAVPPSLDRREGEPTHLAGPRRAAREALHVPGTVRGVPAEVLMSRSMPGRKMTASPIRRTARRPTPNRRSCRRPTQKFLAALEQKLQVVRDFTGSVASGRTSGFFLWGKGGVGKVAHGDRGAGAAPGAVQAVQLADDRAGTVQRAGGVPHAVHLLEDIEPLFRDSGRAGGAPQRPVGRPPEGGWADRAAGDVDDVQDGALVSCSPAAS